MNGSRARGVRRFSMFYFFVRRFSNAINKIREIKSCRFKTDLADRTAAERIETDKKCIALQSDIIRTVAVEIDFCYDDRISFLCCVEFSFGCDEILIDLMP